jgi:hypothetical protein
MARQLRIVTAGYRLAERLKVCRKAVPRLKNELKQRMRSNIERKLDAGVTHMMNIAQDAKKRQLMNC